MILNSTHTQSHGALYTFVECHQTSCHQIYTKTIVKNNMKELEITVPKLLELIATFTFFSWQTFLL